MDLSLGRRAAAALDSQIPPTFPPDLVIDAASQISEREKGEVSRIIIIFVARGEWGKMGWSVKGKIQLRGERGKHSSA